MKKLALTIFFDSFILMLIGLVIVLTASSTYSALKFDSSFHLFNAHLIRVLVGLFLLLAFCFIPYEVYKNISKPLIIGITIVLIVTLFIAPTVKGAGRWLSIAGVTFQPADAAKLILVMHLAALMDQKSDYLDNFKDAFIYLFIWVVIIAGLIFIQPNISNGILLVVISLTLMFVGGVKFKHIIASTLSLAFLGGLFAMIFNHSRARVLGFIDSVFNGGDVHLQVKQAIYGLGSGGLLGVGIGNSKQNNLFLPEAYGDFIFAILGEETGFVGAVAVMLFYLVLFIAGILIAKKAKDKFGQLLAFGITFSIAIYAFVNIAVATGSMPTTGLPLPFISYGGTSIIFLCISVGILINIAILNSKKAAVNVEQQVQENKFKDEFERK